MSRLALPNGDDHPDAAGKHLDDATALARVQRYDGAAYLCGYVVECAIKTLILLEGGKARGHKLNDLSQSAQRFASLPGARSARYMPGTMYGLAIMDRATGWRETMRYRPPGIVSAGQANAWLEDSQAVYEQTISHMRLDGVI